MPPEKPSPTIAFDLSPSNLPPTRRRFLRQAALAPLALPGGGWLWLPPARQKPAKPCGCHLLPPPSGPVRYDAHCFTIAGRDRLLFGASMHYPRVPRELWRDRLLKLRAAGVNTIETVVFWNYHELVPGQFDLEEFDAYCRLVGEMGMYMIARPGPYICAEWATGGFPAWIVAQRFPLRSPDPRSVATSQEWFNHVLPVIRRRQISAGGPIVLMQIENEYDFWPLPDAEKLAYLTALAGMAWDAGIQVPLFTNWGKQVRERKNPVMARLFDSCDFYPRWDLKSVLAPLQQLRRQVPNAPLAVAELQGGWFAQVGGRLSIEQPGIGPEQLASLTRLVLAQGVTYLNYYMGHGGSNFNWAAQDLTSTYDYAAPVREGGWLWEKYYALREVGMILALAGEKLARSEIFNGIGAFAPDHLHSGVAVTQRVHEPSGAGFLFLQELRGRPQRLALQYGDFAPRRFPARGEIFVPARAARLLPFDWNLNGRHLFNATAEVIAAERSGGREIVVLAGEPGEAVEAMFAASQPPRPTAGAVWNQSGKAVRLESRFGNRARSLLLSWPKPEAELQVFLLPRPQAGRLWISPANAKKAGAGADKLLWLGEVALLEASGGDGQSAWAEVQLSPGRRRLQVALPQTPTACRVQGRPQPFRFGARRKLARLELSIPAAPAAAIRLTPADANPAESPAGWQLHLQPLAASPADSPELQGPELPPLQHFGRLPYGYVVYETRLQAQPAAPRTLALLQLEMHSAQSAWRVFINGRHARETSRSGAGANYNAAPHLVAGSNRIVVCYEMFGAHNFGRHIADLKGLKSGALMRSGESKRISSWRLQRFPANLDDASRGRDLREAFDYSRWPAPAAAPEPLTRLEAAMLWARRSFRLPATPDWFLPWELHLEAGSDALIYVNRKFIGRYAAIGPQHDFYMPEPWLHFGGENELWLLLPYRRSLAGIAAAEVRPIPGAATCRRRIEWRFQSPNGFN